MRAKTGHKGQDSEWSYSSCLILTLGLTETKIEFRQTEEKLENYRERTIVKMWGVNKCQVS